MMPYRAVVVDKTTGAIDTESSLGNSASTFKGEKYWAFYYFRAHYTTVGDPAVNKIVLDFGRSFDFGETIAENRDNGSGSTYYQSCFSLSYGNPGEVDISQTGSCEFKGGLAIAMTEENFNKTHALMPEMMLLHGPAKFLKRHTFTNMDFETFGKITNNFNSTTARIDDYLMDTGEFHNVSKIKDFGFTPFEDISASKTLSNSIVANFKLQ